VKYLVISPVKDEERYVEHTLRSMAAQTIKPVRWIIVDDGSNDHTPDLILNYQKNLDFIQLVTRPKGRPRQPGSAVIQAFNLGLEAAREFDYDFIVKLDCDLSFDAFYFEKLLQKFQMDPMLGIASGIYMEAADGKAWTEIAMPSYHAAGASKVVRRKCFHDICGFVAARGWDTVDEIRAMARGWRTGHFGELKMKHWKLEGKGIGPLRTSLMHGEIYYLTGGSKWFFALKVFHRLTRHPVLMGGVALAWGYTRAWFNQKKRLVTRNEARVYRALLQSRLTERLRRFYKRPEASGLGSVL